MLSDATAVPITPRELMSWTQVARSVMAAQMCAHTCMTIIPAQAPLVRLKPSVGGRPMHAQHKGGCGRRLASQAVTTIVPKMLSGFSPAVQVTTSAMGAQMPSRGRTTRASAASPCRA